MSTSWSNDDRRDYAIPPRPRRCDDRAERVICTYNDWTGLDRFAQWLEYRRMVSMMRRSDLRSALDYLAEETPETTLADVAGAWGDYCQSRPWVQMATVCVGGFVAACCVAGAPTVWAALVGGGW